MLKYQEEYQEEKDPDIFETQGSHMSNQVGAAKIIEKQEGMVNTEKVRMECVGIEWEEEGRGT